MEITEKVTVPVMAMRGITAFPKMVFAFDVRRERSVQALDAAMEGDQNLILLMQKDAVVEEPSPEQIFECGILVHVRQMLKMSGDMIRILVEGKKRVKAHLVQEFPYLTAEYEVLEDEPYTEPESAVEAVLRVIYEYYGAYLELMPKGSADSMFKLMASSDPSYVADFVAQNCRLKTEERQECVELLHPVRRLERVLNALSTELEIMQLEGDIAEKVQGAVNQSQRDYYLREQMRVIREELGEDEEDNEYREYEKKILALKLPEEIQAKLMKELGRMNKQPIGSAEGALLRNYLDICLDLPWNKTTKETVNIEKARKMLDQDHYGLEQVKKRILELLAVRKFAPDVTGQILCLVGPPGVGKTSIATSIARCLNRKLARISLGGVHDEAEIRGHRKTYIGAMPGRIISGMITAGSMNPVLILDEIDKVGADYRGDPSAALLEVLDGEQNETFRDNFLEIPFDLSNVLFITTANTTATIPAALLDRMEMIELSSYTDEEKVMIAKRHLFPKELQKVGLKKRNLTITDAAWREIIDGYTRESGVRNLQREIGSVCRKAALKFATDETLTHVTVKPANLQEMLGVRKYLKDEMEQEDQVGLVTGLAWTSVGGVTLEVEANVMPGNGKLEMTGSLGEVMKESVHAAMSYIRSHANELGVAEDFYKVKDIHVHFPEGAVPKDGPSAGVTICTAMVSALTGRPARRDIAMTGEISIRGRVMAIGGLKEKTMAALRHGVKTVIIPQENLKDLEDIDPLVREKLTFIPVSEAGQVLKEALCPAVPEPGSGSGETAETAGAAC